jgi:hypothetical protein
MRILTKILFICAMTVGLAVAASAQKDGDKKPPKPPPPVINPAPRPPKDSDKPKKPGAEAMVFKSRSDEETV